MIRKSRKKGWMEEENYLFSVGQTRLCSSVVIATLAGASKQGKNTGGNGEM